MGCHQIIPGQTTILMGLKQYQDAQDQLPPKLLTEGARVDPEWLRKFLSNPSLTTIGYESQRRASVFKSPHANVLVLGQRTAEAGSFL